MVSIYDRTEEIILAMHSAPAGKDRVTKDYALTEEGYYMRIQFYYDLGGYNHFNGSNERRGYYVSARPIKKSDRFVTQNMFSGAKKFLGEEVTRKSKKAHKTALKALTPEVLRDLMVHVIEP